MQTALVTFSTFSGNVIKSKRPFTLFEVYFYITLGPQNFKFHFAIHSQFPTIRSRQRRQPLRPRVAPINSRIVNWGVEWLQSTLWNHLNFETVNYSTTTFGWREAENIEWLSWCASKLSNKSTRIKVPTREFEYLDLIYYCLGFQWCYDMN